MKDVTKYLTLNPLPYLLDLMPTEDFTAVLPISGYTLKSSEEC